MQASDSCVSQSSLEKGKASGNNVVSVEQAEDLKMKEKRKREREKKLPQKKRRRLEAAKETLEIENETDDVQKKGKKDKGGIPLVDLAYRRAKAVKAKKRAEDSGKMGKVNPTGKREKHVQPRTEEVRELFQADMIEKQLKRNLKAGMGKKKSSFKSKSRYKCK